MVVVAPVATYVNALTANVAPAQSLLQAGQDPHHFALAPSQQQMLESADILIIPDLSMSPAIAGLAAKYKKLKIIQLSNLGGANPLPYADENPWLLPVKAEKEAKKETKTDTTKRLPGFDEDTTPQEQDKNDASIDPHFWLDPERMAALAGPLADAIGEFSPAHKKTLQVNAKTLARHLRQEVMPEMRGLLVPQAPHHTMSEKPTIPFITYHAAYQYFLARFKLSHEGELTARPEDYLGAKSLDTVLNSAKAVRIRCLIGETGSPLMTRVAELSGAKIVLLSPEQNIGQNEVPPLGWMQNDYDRLLYKTAKSFGECL